METVHAVFENGFFRPTAPVKLPENCEVEFVPTVVASEGDDGIDRDPLYEVLMRKSSSGRHDLAERHNEHQP